MLNVRHTSLVQRHELDKSDLIGMPDGHLSKIKEFVVIETLHDDDIDFNWRKTDCLGHMNAIQNLLQVPSSRYIIIFFGIQRVETHVDTFHTGLIQGARHLIKENAISCQRNLLKTFNPMKRLEKIKDATSNERLSPSDPRLYDPQRNSSADNFQNLFIS